jgi:hypothetical protein
VNKGDGYRIMHNTGFHMMASTGNEAFFCFFLVGIDGTSLVALLCDAIAPKQRTGCWS